MKNAVILFLLFSLILSPLKAQKSFQVTIKGKGDPVFLFPGFGCTSEVWDDVVSDLSKTYECHLFTFAGFGDVPPIETPWLSTIKEEIIAYTKDKKLMKPALVGHSLGGALSYWLAIAEPGLFKKIIAVDALPCSAAMMIPNYKGDKIPYDNPQSQSMLRMDTEAFDKMINQMIPFMCKNTEKHKTIENMMKKTDRKTYVYGYIDLLNLDLRNEIAQIKIPVTVLAATFPDKATVKKTYDEQFKKLPSAEIKYAENAAHFLMYDQPEWLIRNLTESLK